MEVLNYIDTALLVGIFWRLSQVKTELAVHEVRIKSLEAKKA